MERDQLAHIWPQFALQIAIGGARLHTPTDTELSQLARRAAEPEAVLPATDSHFVTWIHDRTPGEIVNQRIDLARSNRDLVKRPGWTLDLTVIVAGEPVGMQSLSGFDQWPRRRIVGTTSWLLAPFQRGGLGTRARAAVLELAFVHLNAAAAKSWVLEDNQASVLVSTKLGYEVIDRHCITERGHTGGWTHRSAGGTYPSSRALSRSSTCWMRAELRGPFVSAGRQSSSGRRPTHASRQVLPYRRYNE